MSNPLLLVLLALFFPALVYSTCSTESFDYIIIGSNAGSVVARALSESKPGASILIMERGSLLNTSNAYIPNLPRAVPEYTYGNAFGYFPANINAQTTYQLGALIRQISFNIGNVTGGDSEVNSMYFIDQSASYDLATWPTGLQFSDMLPSYKWVEAFQGNPNTVNSTLRGFNGILNISDYTGVYNDTLSPIFFESCVANGIYNNPDFSSNDLGGCGFFDRTIYKGKRVNAWDWMINKAGLSSVTTWQYVEVTGFTDTFDLWTQQSTITSVSYTRLDTGESCTVKALKTVVISAGALGTPALLQKAFPLLTNPFLPIIPAGENLHDDVGTPLVYNLTTSLYTNAVLNETTVFASLNGYINSLNEGEPDLTNVWAYAVANSGAFLKSNSSLAYPDLEAYLSLSAPFNQVPGGYPNIVAFPILLINATSTGNVIYFSENNTIAVNPNYLALSSDNDINALYQGLLLVRQIATTPPFSHYIAGEVAPGIFVNARKREIPKISERLSRAVEMALESTKKRGFSAEESDQTVKRAIKKTLDDYRVDIIEEARAGAQRFYQTKGREQDLPTVDEVFHQEIPEMKKFVEESYEDIIQQQTSKGKRDIGNWDIVDLDWTVFLGLIEEVALKLYIRYTALAGEHFCCTSKMGNPSDSSTVVDTTGLVKGFTNLRIIDMSSIPSLPHTNPQRRLYAFAKTMAGFIE